jgi:hypothetical protein
MRLFEVDQGSARDVLAVLQGLANKPGDQQPSELPFPVVMKLIQPFGLGISSPDGLIALKNAIDPAGDVFDISDDGKGTVILNTKEKSPDQAQQLKKPTGPAVDSMASSNAKNLSPNI